MALNNDDFTFNEFKQALFDYIDNKNQWDSITVNGIQYDKGAFKELLSNALLMGSKVARISKGVSTIRDHSEVSGNDDRTAVDIFEKGIDQVLPDNSTGW